MNAPEVHPQSYLQRFRQARTSEQLEELLCEPCEGVVETFRRVRGDVLVLGAGGKMGPSLARMARRAADLAGGDRRVIAVSRFGSGDLRERLEGWGLETIAADLLDEAALADLPDAPNVIYMAGMKFGSTGQEARTWMMNCYLPARVADRYRESRIVAFSTGNVYGLQPLAGGGSREEDPLEPLGDYAVSCAGRERMFEYAAEAYGTPVALIRLNYAVDLRYGVLVDLAGQLLRGEAIDLSMGMFNVIWQGDANAMTLRALEQAASPAWAVNVTGPEALSTRAVVGRLAERLGVEARFAGEETDSALLSCTERAQRLWGYPRVTTGELIEKVAAWIAAGGELLDKPTHFQTRDGKF